MNLFSILIVVVCAALGATNYVRWVDTNPKVAELARLTFAAAMLAIMLRLALGTQDAILHAAR